MKVVLLQDVKKLGKSGDVVEVADGYGRNVLIRRGLGIEGLLDFAEKRSFKPKTSFFFIFKRTLLTVSEL